MRGTQRWPPANGNGTPAIPVGDGKHSDGPELVGYARVSTRSQNDDSQLADLTAAGCTRIFIDHGVSGKLASRPELDKAVAYMRPGDTFVITRLSRAMRSLKHLLTLTDEFKEAGIGLKVLKQEIDTTTSTGRLIFKILGAIDEWQRELIVEGTLEGLETARAKGHVGGRRRTVTKEQEDLAITMLTTTTEPFAGIARSLKVSKPALYRALQRRGALPQPLEGDQYRGAVTLEDRGTILTMLKNGHNYSSAARATGHSQSTVRRVWAASGEKDPPPGHGRPQPHTIPGRPRTVDEKDARTAQRLIQDGASMAEAAAAIGKSRASLYRALDRIEQASTEGSEQ